MFKTIQKLSPAPPTRLYSPVAPSTHSICVQTTIGWYTQNFKSLVVFNIYIQIFCWKSIAHHTSITVK